MGDVAQGLPVDLDESFLEPCCNLKLLPLLSSFLFLLLPQESDMYHSLKAVISCSTGKVLIIPSRFLLLSGPQNPSL